MKEISLLDCTLRDGGNALEDEIEFWNNKKEFSKNSVNKIINNLVEAKIENIEIGVVEKECNFSTGCSYYKSIESLSKNIPLNRGEKQMFLAGINIRPEWLNEIPEKNDTLCDGLRVYLRYSELEKSLKFSEKLSEKGYKIFLQNALTMRYSKSDLELVIKYANKIKAYAVYIVDSNGYMFEGDVKRIAIYLDERLDEGIKIGFHAHNNLNMAFSNVRTLLNLELMHDIIIDSCLMGMGRGAGNLQTELIVPYMNKNYNKKYNFGSVLEAYEFVEAMDNRKIWGYSAMTLLSAVYETSSKYCMYYRNKYQCSYKEIDKILKRMPKDYKYRYTENNAESLYSLLKNRRDV